MPSADMVAEDVADPLPADPHAKTEVVAKDGEAIVTATIDGNKLDDCAYEAKAM